MKIFALSLLAAVVFYAIGAAAGGWLLSIVSTNRHDRAVEAAMTGAFVFGPVAAILAFFVTFFLLRSRG